MSLAIQNRQLILRSSDGTGDNNQKTFTVGWTRILSSTFGAWLVHSKFVSQNGDYEGVSSEVRWSLTANNQTDTRGTGQTLCFPTIKQNIALNGTLDGSVLISELHESLRLYISPSPTSTTLTISVFDATGTLMSDMSQWTLCLIFEPVAKR